MTPPFRPALLLAFLLAGCSHSSSAGLGAPGDLKLEAVKHNPGEDNRLFLRYQGMDFSEWNRGWPATVDMSGVAWDDARAATAITPMHVVMAGHFARPPGTRVVFHDRKGWPQDRILRKVIPLSQMGISCDIAVGLLDRPLPPSIHCYPLLKPRADLTELLQGSPILVTDQNARLFIHRIDNLIGDRVAMNFDDSVAASLRKNLIVGDSGHPSFLLVGGQPVLVETHTFGGSGSGPFYSAPATFAALTKLVAQLDPSHSIRTVDLDREFLRQAAERKAARPPAPAPQPAPAPVQAPAGVKPTIPPPNTPPAPRQPRPRVIVPPAKPEGS